MDLFERDLHSVIKTSELMAWLSNSPAEATMRSLMSSEVKL